MDYCRSCKQNVEPQSPLNLGRTVALLVVALILVLIVVTKYAGIGVAVGVAILVVIAKIVMESYNHSRRTGWICPICKGKDWGDVGQHPPNT